MNNQPVYWKMKNGKSISVDDMDLNHLRNVLKLILRNRDKYNKIIAEHNKRVQMDNTFTLNGDMANEFNESYLSDEDDDRFDEIGIGNYDADEFYKY